MNSLIDRYAIDLDQTVDVLVDALHFTTRHMASCTIHQGVDCQGRAFIVVTDGAGESLVIRPQDLGHAALLRPRPPAANDGA